MPLFKLIFTKIDYSRNNHCFISPIDQWKVSQGMVQLEDEQEEGSISKRPKNKEDGGYQIRISLQANFRKLNFAEFEEKIQFYESLPAERGLPALLARRSMSVDRAKNNVAQNNTTGDSEGNAVASGFQVEDDIDDEQDSPDRVAESDEEREGSVVVDQSPREGSVVVSSGGGSAVDQSPRVIVMEEEQQEQQEPPEELQSVPSMNTNFEVAAKLKSQFLHKRKIAETTESSLTQNTPSGSGDISHLSSSTNLIEKGGDDDDNENEEEEEEDVTEIPAKRERSDSYLTLNSDTTGMLDITNQSDGGFSSGPPTFETIASNISAGSFLSFNQQQQSQLPPLPPGMDSPLKLMRITPKYDGINNNFSPDGKASQHAFFPPVPLFSDPYKKVNHRVIKSILLQEEANGVILSDVPAKENENDHKNNKRVIFSPSKNEEMENSNKNEKPFLLEEMNFENKTLIPVNTELYTGPVPTYNKLIGIDQTTEEEIKTFRRTKELIHELKSRINPPNPFHDLFQLTFLGTGCATPSKYRNSSSIMVRLFDRQSSLPQQKQSIGLSPSDGGLSDDPIMLLDCGEGTTSQIFQSVHGNLERFDNVLTNIRVIWISHHHADHATGIPGLVHYIRKAQLRKARKLKQQQQREEELKEQQEEQENEKEKEKADENSKLTDGRTPPTASLAERRKLCVVKKNLMINVSTVKTFYEKDKILLLATDKILRYYEELLKLSNLQSLVTFCSITNTLYAGMTSDIEKATNGIVKKIQSVPVIHCQNSFGLVMEFHRELTTTEGGSDNSSDVESSSSAMVESPLPPLPHHHLRHPSSSGRTKNNNKNYCLVYSGDCRPSQSLIRAGQGCHLLIHEATFSEEKAADALKKKHSTINEAISTAIKMNAKHLILTHFSQRYPIHHVESSMPTNPFQHQPAPPPPLPPPPPPPLPPGPPPKQPQQPQQPQSQSSNQPPSILPPSQRQFSFPMSSSPRPFPYSPFSNNPYSSNNPNTLSPSMGSASSTAMDRAQSLNSFHSRASTPGKMTMTDMMGFSSLVEMEKIVEYEENVSYAYDLLKFSFPSQLTSLSFITKSLSRILEELSEGKKSGLHGGGMVSSAFEK
jgi:ribonuclease BN (tRNA processing enzyme)